MPTYDYTCTACGHNWELFQSMTAKPEKACPSCKKRTAKRLIGTGAALLFKGSGFYLTDYRSDSYKKSADADKPATAETKATESQTVGAKNPEVKSQPAEKPKPETKAMSKAEPKSAAKADTPKTRSSSRQER